MVASYTVRKGDSLTAIAARNHVTLDELINSNPEFIKNKRNIDAIEIGEALVIPDSSNAKTDLQSLYKSYLLSKAAVAKGLPADAIIDAPAVKAAKSAPQLRDAITKINMDSILASRVQVQPETAPINLTRGFKAEDRQKEENKNQEPFSSVVKDKIGDITYQNERAKNLYLFGVLPRAAISTAEYVKDLKAGTWQNPKYGDIANKPLFRAFTGVNTPVGLFVATQYGGQAVGNITNMIDHWKDANYSAKSDAYYTVSNLSQSLNGVAFGIRGYDHLQHTLKFLPELTTKIPARTGFYGFLSHEWASGTFLNLLFGLTRMEGKYAAEKDEVANLRLMSTVVPDPYRAQEMRYSASYLETLNGQYHYGAGTIFALNEAAPYQCNGFSILWFPWLLGRIGGYFQKASRFEYFGIQKGVDANDAVVDPFVKLADSNAMQTALEHEYVNNDYGAQIWRALAGRGKDLVEQSMPEKATEEQKRILNDLSNTQERIRIGLNWVLYGAATIAGIRLWRKFAPVARDRFNVRIGKITTYLKERAAGSNSPTISKMHYALTKAEMILNPVKTRLDAFASRLPLVGHRKSIGNAWSTFVGGYIGFNVFHFFSQMTSGIVNRNMERRTDIIYKDTKRGLDCNLNPIIIAHTGFWDDRVAGVFARLIHRRELDAKLSDAKRQLKYEVPQFVVEALNPKNFEFPASMTSRVLWSIAPVNSRIAAIVTKSKIDLSGQNWTYHWSL